MGNETTDEQIDIASRDAKEYFGDGTENLREINAFYRGHELGYAAAESRLAVAVRALEHVRDCGMLASCNLCKHQATEALAKIQPRERGEKENGKS